MNTYAVVALVLGTLVVLLAPALLLSTDLLERFRSLRTKTLRH